MDWVYLSVEERVAKEMKESGCGDFIWAIKIDC